MATAEKRSSGASKKRVFILDTNVLVHDPTAFLNFEQVLVGIPSIVLEELDQFKREGTDRGRNTREVVRQLDALRERGSLKDGVKLENGATLRILFTTDDMPKLPFEVSNGDNSILRVAYAMAKEGYHVTFISKDLNARVKADALGLQTEDYIEQKVTPDEFYRGWHEVTVPSIQLKSEDPGILKELAQEKDITPNHFIILSSKNNPHNFKLFRLLPNGTFKPVYEPSLRWPFQARNPQQLMALDLLLDRNIQFVTLFGPAGTGKTFLALLAGLHEVLRAEVYEKMLISRPVVPLGRDIGYLPGDVQEKLHNWMLPIYDNMEFIIHKSTARSQEGSEQDQEEFHGNHRGKDRRNKHPHHQNKKKDRGGLMPLDELMYRGKVSMEAITYMRGRSIPYQYILIDEAQNLTPHEVKTIVSRVGEGSKIVLVGDPYQIDSPYLDFSSNGLIVTSEKFKGQDLFGTVYLSVTERSRLSQLASDLL